MCACMFIDHALVSYLWDGCLKPASRKVSWLSTLALIVMSFYFAQTAFFTTLFDVTQRNGKLWKKCFFTRVLHFLRWSWFCLLRLSPELFFRFYNSRKESFGFGSRSYFHFRFGVIKYGGKLNNPSKKVIHTNTNLVWIVIVWYSISNLTLFKPAFSLQPLFITLKQLKTPLDQRPVHRLGYQNQTE